MKSLQAIQTALKVGKGRFNSFSGFCYRSAEDILTAVKPLMKEHPEALLTLSDEVIAIGEHLFVKATATFEEPDGVRSVCGWARQAIDKKGMDAPQMTGCASSYARKFALCGLFLIDDERDPDMEQGQTKVAQERVCAPAVTMPQAPPPPPIPPKR